MNIFHSLSSISPYPIPSAAIHSAVAGVGLSGEDEVSPSVLRSRAYKLAQAQLYRYLAAAPNISQGGISYTFSADERNQFLRLANTLYEEAGEDGTGATFGYKGEDL